MGKISTPSLDMNLLLLADRTGYRSNSPACHKIELEKSFFFFFGALSYLPCTTVIVQERARQ